MQLTLKLGRLGPVHVPSIYRGASGPVLSSTLLSRSTAQSAPNSDEIVPGGSAMPAEKFEGVIDPSLFYSPSVTSEKDRGLYVVGRRPSCTIVGLRRITNTVRECSITTIEDLTSVGEAVRKQDPFDIFIIDASYQPAISSVGVIVHEAANHTQYRGRQLRISVVESGIEGIISHLQREYARAPIHFFPARKYGEDIIDLQLGRYL